MTQYVIDSSVAVRAVHETGLDPSATYYAPELIDIEFANALRKTVLRGEADEAPVERAISAWALGSVVRTSHAPLLQRVWQLRHTITPYDAAYVALAESMGIPLITADRRLAASAAAYCEVITIG